MLFEKKTSYLIWIAVGLITYATTYYLVHDTSRVRIHWFAALLLEIGGPHLLSAVAGILAGFGVALWYETKDYGW